MKNTLIILIFSLLALSVNAQTFEEEYIINSNPVNSGVTEENDNEKIREKYSFQVNLGTSLMTWKNGSALSTYINPNLNYQLTPRFSLAAGIIMSHNTLLSSNETNNSLITNYLHFSGIYQVNEKLQVNGSVLYSIHPTSSSLNPNAFDNLNYSVGAKYKLTKNIELGVQFTKRSNNPYLYNSFENNSFENNPFDE